MQLVCGLAPFDGGFGRSGVDGVGGGCAPSLVCGVPLKGSAARPVRSQLTGVRCVPLRIDRIDACTCPAGGYQVTVLAPLPYGQAEHSRPLADFGHELRCGEEHYAQRREDQSASDLQDIYRPPILRDHYSGNHPGLRQM
jgi:hypothetical protein